MASIDSKQSEFLWRDEAGTSRSMTRKLSGPESMFYLLNKTLFGQNCPFIGATVSIQRYDIPSGTQHFTLDELQKRACVAFSQTRYKYPTVAARVIDGDKALYIVDPTEDVESWAKKNVTVLQQDGGWLTLRETLSRSSSMPTEDGNYCALYLVVRPDVAKLPGLTTFDVLIHIHHVFVDGSGIRSILNEFLARLASPLPSGDISWGQEVERLYPPSILLENETDEEVPDRTETVQKMRENGIDLPLYRPDILSPDPQHRGTLLLSHTFENEHFLPHLLSAGRQRGVKLTALLQAAMLQAVVYRAAAAGEAKPRASHEYTTSAAVDLRARCLIAPYGERSRYVNNAITLEPIEFPGRLFQENNHNDFWALACHLAAQWAAIRDKSGFDTKSFYVAMPNRNIFSNSSSSDNTPVKPSTAPYYVSDPPGSQQLSPSYAVSLSGLSSSEEGGSLRLVLDSYQLATDQNQAVVSTRSHSWNGKLTLCVAFNAVRNPKDKMQDFLDAWVARVETVISEAKSAEVMR